MLFLAARCWVTALHLRWLVIRVSQLLPGSAAHRPAPVASTALSGRQPSAQLRYRQRLTRGATDDATVARLSSPRAASLSLRPCALRCMLRKHTTAAAGMFA